MLVLSEESKKNLDWNHSSYLACMNRQSGSKHHRMCHSFGQVLSRYPVSMMTDSGRQMDFLKNLKCCTLNINFKYHFHKNWIAVARADTMDNLEWAKYLLLSEWHTLMSARKADNNTLNDGSKFPRTEHPLVVKMPTIRDKIQNHVCLWRQKT